MSPSNSRPRLTRYVHTLVRPSIGRIVSMIVIFSLAFFEYYIRHIRTELSPGEKQQIVGDAGMIAFLVAVGWYILYAVPKLIKILHERRQVGSAIIEEHSEDTLSRN